MTMQRQARLRVCASCEWIFRWEAGGEEISCPRCGFASYGARFVYGNKAYRYEHTQEPWMKRKLEAYRWKLQQEIQEAKRQR